MTRCRVMGILNVTPDSFSDGGRFLDRDTAVEHALAMLDEGADIIDIGGESTRPGAEPVPASDEIARVVPVIAAVRSQRPDAVVSIDTMKAAVASAAIDAGASIVNDVSAGRDPDMFSLVAARGVDVVLMHMQGEPRTMQQDPRYDDVVVEVREALAARTDAAVAAGIERARIIADPGIGFGKTREHNLTLLKHLDAFEALGVPILVGASRKTFIGLTLDVPPDERLEGSLAVAAWAALHGAAILRVHDVRETVRMLRMLDAIRSA